MEGESKQQETHAQELDELRGQIRKEMERAWQEVPEVEKRQEQLSRRIPLFVEFGILSEAQAEAIMVAATIVERDAYFKAMLEAYEPVIRFKVEQPEAFDTLQERIQEQREVEDVAESEFRPDRPGWSMMQHVLGYPILADRKKTMHMAKLGLSRSIAALFRFVTSPEERRSRIAYSLELYRDAGGLSPEAYDRLQAACQIEDKQEFLKEMKEILTPLIEWRLDHPADAEAVQRELYFKKNLQRINDLFVYEIRDDGYLELHVPPNIYTPGVRKFTLLQQAHRWLARYLTEHPEIKGVVGNSWVVAKNPRLAKRMGYEVESIVPGNEEMGDESFGIARISREELIKRFG